MTIAAGRYGHSPLCAAIVRVASCAALLVPAPALAQSSGANSPGVQLQEKLRQFEVSAEPKELGIDLSNSKEDLPSTENPVSQKKMLLQEVTFKGNRKFNDDFLVEFFQELIGKEVTFANLKQSISQITTFYKSAGYITSLAYLPEQSFASGVVEVQVVEGFIEKIEITGANDSLRAYVKDMLASIPGGVTDEIFEFSILERQLILMRDFGGFNYKTTLSRGSRLGGSVLTVQLEKDSWSGGLTTDNNVANQLGDLRSGVYAQYVSKTNVPIKLNVSGNYALSNYAYPDDYGLIDGIASISFPLGNKGLKASLLWATSYTNTKDLYQGPSKVETLGKSMYWSFGMDYPIVARRNAQLRVGLKGTGQNSTNDIHVDDRFATNVSANKLRVARLSVDGFTYDAASTHQMSLVVSQGLSNIDDVLDPGDFPSNPYADSTFTAGRLNLSADYRLFGGDTIFSVKGAGQLASGALPVPEQFTFGGPVFGRGFKSTHILGDQGYSGIAQFEHNFFFKGGTSSLTPFAWIDYGSVNNLAGPLPSQRAATYGIGLKGSAWRGKSNFEVAWGTPALNSLDTSNVGKHSSTVYFKVGVGF